MDVSSKTIGELIDQLITADLRCWHAQDSLMDKSLSDKERLDAAILAQKTNARRTSLIRAIDERLGEGALTGFMKSYDNKDS